MTNPGYYSNSRLDILSHETAVSQQPGPQLHTDDAKDEEDEKAQRQHVAQHGESVKQKGHQDTHT